MENTGGNLKGIDPVREQNKTKRQRQLLPRTLKTISLHGVGETGTELCPLHHIRQLTAKKEMTRVLEHPSPPSIMRQPAIKNKNGRSEESGWHRMCVEF